MTQQPAALRAAAGPPPVTRLFMTRLVLAAIVAPSPCGAQPWRYLARVGSQRPRLLATVTLGGPCRTQRDAKELYTQIVRPGWQR